MATVVTVTSGKGGVGKTTSFAAIAAGLAQAGYRTVVIYFDVGLRNLDLIMGVERRVVFDFVNVISGEATLNQALIQDKRLENLSSLVASQTKDKDSLTEEGVGQVLDELAELGFEYIVCDYPVGIERGATMAIHFSDHAVIVTNPEVSSVRDADRIPGILQSKSKRAKEGGKVHEHLLITRYNPVRVENGEMLSKEDVCDILAVKLIGVIPESKAVLKASNTGVPVILDEDSDAGLAYSDSVAPFWGEDRPMRFVNPRKQGLLSRILGGGD